MRVLLTGCSGYIGSRLAARLSQNGHEVLGIDRIAYQGNDLSGFVECDLADGEKYKDILGSSIDLVMHLAAAKGDWGITEEEYERDNYEATRVLLQYGKQAGIKNWLFYSTVAVLGPSSIPLDEQAPFSPLIPYGTSKAKAERLFSDLVKSDPATRALILRPSAVFGPGNPPSTNIHRLIETILKDRFIMIGDGQSHKTTSYIENLLDATIFLVGRGWDGLSIYHYVDMPVVSTEELVSRIYRFLGRERRSVRLPIWLAATLGSIGDMAARIMNVDFPITAARMNKFCTSTLFSSEKIRREGFVQMVDNETALRRTIEWHLNEFSQSHREA